MKHHDFLFQWYVKQLLVIFQHAIGQKDPALFLYRNKARSLLFMVEGLLRLVNALVIDKEVKQTLKTIKKIEDMLGQIDEFDEQLQAFSKNKEITNKQLHYLQAKRNQAVQRLDLNLRKKEYYQELFNNIIATFTINFSDKVLVNKFRQVIADELGRCRKYYQRYPNNFRKIEEVHEMRRKLRWISIYGECLRGIISLRADGPSYRWEKKFITRAEHTSKYTKLVVNKTLAQHILFDKKAFLSFSYVVRRLGIVKDEGLAILHLEKSLRKTGMKGTRSEKTARQLLGTKRDLDLLLNEGHDLLKQFFMTYKIDDALIVR